MLEPVGKKLQQTRLRKNLTVEEVARLTRIHRDRIADLENDDYSNFPNLSYAKSFLTLYAKHLGVDVHDVASSFGRHDQFGLDDYEYLSNTSQERSPVMVDTDRRSMLPLAVAGGVVIVALIITFIVVSANRLGDLETLAVKERPPRDAGSATPVEVAEPTAASAAATDPVAGPVIPAVQPPAAPAGPPSDENIEVRRAVPLSEEDAAAAAAAEPANEVVLQPLKKTWVKVRQGDAGAAVVFEDFLYPDASPLTLKGDEFFIQADADGANLKITQNGRELTYRPPGLKIE